MDGAEFLRERIIETSSPDLLGRYRYAQRTIQKAIKAFIEPTLFGRNDSTSGLGLTLLQLQETPASVSSQFDPEDPVTKAAMLVGAISTRAWLYKGDPHMGHVGSYEEIWRYTNLHRLAAKCDEVVADVVPETSGKFVNVSLGAMSEDFNTKLEQGADEQIVVTGLNAVGKSTILRSFEQYLGICDINASILKMPRPDGPLSKVINQALHGELHISPKALQLVFLADALDLKPEPDTLLVFDRHPIAAEAFVYGSTSVARTALATREIPENIYHTFIIDQHPGSCVAEVAKRSSAPRIFERDIENMTEQFIRFARLSVLPGLHWINNDIPISSYGMGFTLATATERFYLAVHFSGVLQRHLLKTGRFTRFSEATNFLYKSWIDFVPTLERTLNIK